jgi:hypothetical protein
MAGAFIQSGQPRLAQAGQDWRRTEMLIGELRGNDQAKRLEALKELKKIREC